MTSGYTVLGPQIVESLHDPLRDFAYDVLVGLSEVPKRLSSKYFYDDRGSRYFQQIMTLPEYYPTDSEKQILERHADAIVAPVLAGPINLVDLGAGDGAKTMIVLEALRRAGADFTYVPIDISEGAMKQLVRKVHERLPDVHVAGLVSEYNDGVHYLGRGQGRTNLVLFLGSNIGNFNRVQARAFLRRLWSSLREGDHALVGFDLKKDIEILLAAYNDPKGVTADFNLNLLLRMNRELGADFDVSSFRHYGTYNVFSGAMESYLVSLEPQVVRIDALEQSFAFDAWEPIHTEYSYKYLRSDVESLAADTGFAIVERFEDDRRWFLDALWRVERGHRAPEPRE
jgi:dimethylhistidine N-methyltransferase